MTLLNIELQLVSEGMTFYSQLDQKLKEQMYSNQEGKTETPIFNLEFDVSEPEDEELMNYFKNTPHGIHNVSKTKGK